MREGVVYVVALAGGRGGERTVRVGNCLVRNCVATVGHQFAAHNEIPVAIFYGPDEQEEGMVTLRSVTFGEMEQDVQQARKSKNVKVPVADIVAEVKALQAE